jgi:tRNA A-37 threonylcarbamoyl transferase component Bud32
MADRVPAGARVTKLGRYEVLNELGKGAMGIVYLAKDPVIGRLVAIKTIRTSQTGDDDSESREFRERFVREAQTAGILSHPNIVTIHDIGEDSETRTSFIAMEYIEGRNLKMLVGDRKRFSSEEIADLIAQIAEALDYAHRKGIIHRDVKPANIILTTDGKVKITDFGIAKVASSNLTTTGQFLGTPNYMSPEQVSGAPVDGRSDIFSLGVVLYELLTNRKPFQGDNLTAISYKIVHEDFTPPADLSQEVPPEFNPIVARAMAKDPWNRYQRGKDMALALYQLKAHLEEQKALQDLGTMVSAAENLPTLKLANLKEIAAQGAPAEGARADTASIRADASPGPKRAVPDDEDEQTRAAPEMGAGQGGILPPEGAGMAPVGSPAAGAPVVVAAAAQELKKLAKAEVNPRWFWIVTAAAAGLVVLVVGVFVLRARSASRPTVQPDAAFELEVHERRQALEEAKKLFAEGRYEESLARVRQVLARSPNNQEARQYAQMAETAVRGQQEETQKKEQIAGLLETARTALSEGKDGEAKQKAEEILALDEANEDARSIRDDAEKKIAAAKSAAVAARRKSARSKGAKAAQGKEAAPPAAAVAGPAAGPAASAAPAEPPPSPTAATLRLSFDSPLPQGHVMVAVNDKIILRRPFSFKKDEARAVTANMTLQPGPASIKAWLSGPDMPSAFATTNARLSAGETRTLRLDFSGGKLSVRVQ